MTSACGIAASQHNMQQMKELQEAQPESVARLQKEVVDLQTELREKAVQMNQMNSRIVAVAQTAALSELSTQNYKEQLTKLEYHALQLKQRVTELEHQHASTQAELQDALNNNEELHHRIQASKRAAEQESLLLRKQLVDVEQQLSTVKHEKHVWGEKAKQAQALLELEHQHARTWAEVQDALKNNEELHHRIQASSRAAEQESRKLRKQLEDVEKQLSIVKQEKDDWEEKAKQAQALLDLFKSEVNAKTAASAEQPSRTQRLKSTRNVTINLQEAPQQGPLQGSSQEPVSEVPKNHEAQHRHSPVAAEPDGQQKRPKRSTMNKENRIHDQPEELISRPRKQARVGATSKGDRKTRARPADNNLPTGDSTAAPTHPAPPAPSQSGCGVAPEAETTQAGMVDASVAQHLDSKEEQVEAQKQASPKKANTTTQDNMQGQQQGTKNGTRTSKIEKGDGHAASKQRTRQQSQYESNFDQEGGPNQTVKLKTGISERQGILNQGSQNQDRQSSQVAHLIRNIYVPPPHARKAKEGGLMPGVGAHYQSILGSNFRIPSLRAQQPR